MNPFDINKNEPIQTQTVFAPNVRIELIDVVLVSDELDVNHRIIKERNDSIHDLDENLVVISDIWTMLGLKIHEQGEILDIAGKQVDNSVINTNDGVDNLEKASNYVKNRLIVIRDMAIVIGGGVLGSTGFLLGPVVGLGTLVGGVAGGGAVVAGIHKVAANRK